MRPLYFVVLTVERQTGLSRGCGAKKKGHARSCL